MIRNRLNAILLGALLAPTLAGLPAFALDSAEVLPSHIDSPSLKYGMVSNLNQRYTANGSLMALADINSVTFDAAKLIAIRPQAQQLVSVLNQFGQQQMGSALTLGTLKIDVTPQLNYIAPIHAHGITNNWTVAAALPVIHYKSTTTLSQTGSNIGVLRQYAGGISPELNSAFDELSANLKESVQQELVSKGYKPFANHDDTYLGDAQLVSLYQIFNNKRTALLSKTTFNAPTGPKDDPDDLTDINTFGMTYFTEAGVLTHMVTPKFRVSGILTLQYNIPDHIDKRVPTNENDSLPDASTKENVVRKIGDSVTLGFSTMYWFLNRWSAGAGLDFMTKAGDRYSGDRGTRYDLLNSETNQTSTTMRLGVTYDTVGAYLAKQAFMPGMITYTYSDIIRGVNIARQTTHELWFTMFF